MTDLEHDQLEDMRADEILDNQIEKEEYGDNC